MSLEMIYYQSTRYYLVLVAQEGSSLQGNSLATALLRHQNRTVPFGISPPPHFGA